MNSMKGSYVFMKKEWKCSNSMQFLYFCLSVCSKVIEINCRKFVTFEEPSFKNKTFARNVKVPAFVSLFWLVKVIGTYQPKLLKLVIEENEVKYKGPALYCILVVVYCTLNFSH
jgi:hypothetical protein